jgi:hypothetical protein
MTTTTTTAARFPNVYGIRLGSFQPVGRVFRTRKGAENYLTRVFSSAPDGAEFETDVRIIDSHAFQPLVRESRWSHAYERISTFRRAQGELIPNVPAADVDLYLRLVGEYEAARDAMPVDPDYDLPFYTDEPWDPSEAAYALFVLRLEDEGYTRSDAQAAADAMFLGAPMTDEEAAAMKAACGYEE